ncbi:ammonium transporter [Parapusillimonas granuli]|uniref:Ammonium transporter n=1 Tax=Parapusillimonas granuli TaxID=380911 RepID=A0A853G6F6_9BURK|nr:ammonium transporter [Parapusillimonas granuli]MBB5214346.1 Amt family ammonium transporter [Parapusillimonas granuli]MEB2399159.1 ammonium transporter [Alcaligenaceae bacterium]NYT51879.1 ammonium transporter [Parapusillimonas granuli]
MDKADLAWVSVSTLLVLLMAVPGLALFYGGLVRAKNVLSVLVQVTTVFALAIVLWFVYGYSLAFTEGNAIVGGFSRLLFSGMLDLASGGFALSGTVPELSFASFQATFAGITCALIVGGFAERARYAAVLVFTAIWMTLCYVPIAHMVWGPGGWLLERGALDFAGGTVVHINSGVAALVGAYFIGKRIGYGREGMQPHNLPMAMIGAALLWVGWFGFNAGSALSANETAALAFFNTLIATAGGILSWAVVEWIHKGNPSLLGGISGAVAGLVGITPGAGLVGPGGALVIGVATAAACVWGVNGLKRMLDADDTLDVFGIHGVGGIVGALLTGVFNAQALGGPGLDSMAAIPGQLWLQLEGVLITVVWSAAVAWLAYFIADQAVGLRVGGDAEREGLDIHSHGETAYHR